jgi:pimeloyl-ACP methyl ester carboxylesterase
MTEFVTSKDGTRIAYEKVGSGPALVLVDGAMCYREFGPCRSAATAFSDRFTVYTYDRRGRGESGDSPEYAPEREYEDLAAIIDAAGGDAYVLGYSSGGALVLQAAASGVRMRKLASYEAPFVGVTEKRGIKPDYVEELNSRLAKGDRGGAVGYFMVDMVGGPAFMPIVMRLMPKVFTALKDVAHTLPYDATIMNGFEVPTATLGRITTPALIMGGSKAKQNMVTAVDGVAAAVPGSVKRTLAGQTHQVKDEAIKPELVEFFA